LAIAGHSLAYGKRRQDMKLCVSSTGKDIGSLVDTTFGRAPYFLIIDTGTMDVVEVVENTAATAGHGAGIAAAQLVSDKGVDGVLTGYVGPNASNALHAAGISIFEGASSQETVKEAIVKFKKDEYNKASAPSEVPPCEPGRGRGPGRGMGRGRGKCRRT
jgi:predicted Fe-Mo cluster-binding NifX family protein